MQQAQDRQKIEIFVSCRSLKDKDVFSKSDPFVTFLLKDQNSTKWLQRDRTETKKDDLNPNFSKSFLAEYIFEMKQECRFEVYDDDGTSTDFLGAAETTIGKLMGSRNQISILDLQCPGSQRNGKIVLRADNIKESNQYLNMQWAGVKLMNTDGWFDKSDPLLRVLKVREDKSTQKLFETEFIKDNLNPVWRPFEIAQGRLCGDNVNQPFKLEVWDWEKNGKYQFIGEVTLTINDLNNGKKEYVLTNPKHKHPGMLRLQMYQSILKPSFLDYVRGGLQLNLMLAVDFTGSNGLPSQPSSLHFRSPTAYNQYQNAIMTVGEILMAYDYDQRVPSFGFGANTRYPNLRSTQVNHCFPLSGDPNHVEALGLPNILELYNYALSNVDLSGPTYFGPIIQEAMRQAETIKTQEQNAYTILLILTDGEIHDMSQTTDLIVRSSHLPLSIIIVGVGNADFGSMNVLDGDSGLTSQSGQKALRDLVQFVPFRQFNGNPVALASHVLAEIPAQVTEYHRLVGKKPNPPIMADLNQLGYSVKPQSQVPNPYGQSQGPQPQGPPPGQNPYGQSQNFGGAVGQPPNQHQYNPQSTYGQPQGGYNQPPSQGFNQPPGPGYNQPPPQNFSHSMYHPQAQQQPSMQHSYAYPSQSQVQAPNNPHPNNPYPNNPMQASHAPPQNPQGQGFHYYPPPH